MQIPEDDELEDMTEEDYAVLLAAFEAYQQMSEANEAALAKKKRRQRLRFSLPKDIEDQLR